MSGKLLEVAQASVAPATPPLVKAIGRDSGGFGLGLIRLHYIMRFLMLLSDMYQASLILAELAMHVGIQGTGKGSVH